MKTVKGIYAEAEIFTDDVEEYAKAQVKMICDNEMARGSRICLMPDIHPGKVGPIGLAMTAVSSWCFPPVSRVTWQMSAAVGRNGRPGRQMPHGWSTTASSGGTRCASMKGRGSCGRKT